MLEFDTPFGKAEFREDLAKGIIAYDVNGSHILFISKKQNKKVPYCFQQPSGWYEEKYQRILAIVFPQCFPSEAVLHARRWLCQEHPEVFEEFTGTIVFPSKEVSCEKHRERFYKNHSRQFIEIKSWTDKFKNVPKGNVLIEAALGGDPWEETTYFLIPEEEYEKHRTEYGFICLLGVHRQRDKV